MELRRWPRKNDPDSIRARQDAIRDAVGSEPLAHDLAPWASAQEVLTGATVIPVSVAGPLAVELEGPTGTLRETGRTTEEVRVPLAHTEGGLSASGTRGAKAAAVAGGFRTYALNDRITRASCFVCKDTADAVTLASWLEGSLEE